MKISCKNKIKYYHHQTQKVNCLFFKTAYFLFVFLIFMEFVGKITYIGKEELVGQNQTPKLSFVVEEIDVQYPNSLCIDLFGEKITLIKGYSIGDIAKIQLTCRTKEYNGKYFNSIGAWKIEKIHQSVGTNIQEENKTTTETPPKQEAKENQNTIEQNTQEDDDLPF